MVAIQTNRAPSTASAGGAMSANEQDQRLRLFNALLTTPHRKLDALWPTHQEVSRTDPRFYVRLAAWYWDNGDVRDHKEAFVAGLALSDFPGSRDVGLALLRQLPPYQVARVLDFVSGRKTTRKVVEKAGPAAKNGKAKDGKAKKGNRAAKGKPAAAPDGATKAPVEVKVKTVTESFGLFRNVPRSMRTEIGRYLREREADADWFDGTVLQARKSLKRLYALNHVKPAERAQRILFDEDPPADSRLFALRQLAKADSPEAQARAIVQNAIPYRVAATVVRQMTPTVLAALVSRMSPQELINNVGSLAKRGAMDVPELRALVEQKLEQAKSGPGAERVSAFKAAKAIEAAGAGVSPELKAKLEQVTDARVKAKGRISRPTALLIDKSGSMTLAIDLGKRIAAMISAVCERELYVYAFDTIAYPIERPFGPAGADLAAWERSLAGIPAGGGTSCGAALEAMRVRQQYVEQVILVTDEGDNSAPAFVPALQKYREAMRADPSVLIVRTPQAFDTVERACRAAGAMVDVFQFAGDYYALPNLIPLISRPSKLELLIEIMAYPLPQRRPA